MVHERIPGHAKKNWRKEQWTKRRSKKKVNEMVDRIQLLFC